MILSARIDTVTMLITCPHCKFSSRYDVSFIEDAIHDGKSIVCVACVEKFEIVTVCQTRDAQLRNEADDVRRACPDCGGSGYMLDEEGIEHECLLCL